jgi:hypothetical protein
MPARTGQEYLEGLRQRRREIWLNGEQVDDVVSHPALANCAHTLARLYDMQHDPATRDALTYLSPDTGKREGTSFIIPRSVEDLVRRRTMVKTWADATCGMMGRTPDFLNVNLMSFAVRPDYFAQNDPRFGDNVVHYYEYVRDHDLCLTHTLVNPQVDRSRQVTELDPYIGLGVVQERQAGLIVRGARMLATLAPFADELAVFPSTFRMEGQDAGKYALCFALPLDTPGLRCLCRESFDYGKSTYDHPLGARFDEMDAVVVFDDVLVHLEGNRPYSGAIEWAKSFAIAGHESAEKPHLGRDFADQRSAVLQGVDIIDRNTNCLISEMALFHRHILGFNANFLQTTNGNQRFPCANLHALDQSRHGHQAGDTQNNAQHGEDGAELMRPNLLKADADRVPQVHESNCAIDSSPTPGSVLCPTRPAWHRSVWRSFRRESRSFWV